MKGLPRLHNRVRLSHVSSLHLRKTVKSASFPGRKHIARYADASHFKRTQSNARNRALSERCRGLLTGPRGTTLPTLSEGTPRGRHTGVASSPGTCIHPVNVVPTA